MSIVSEFTHERRVGYFSMEIALRPDIPTYSGGLGILAGDTLRSATDLELPVVAVTLVSRAGYFRQEIDALGNQVEHPNNWEPANYAKPLDAKVAINIGGRTVWVGGWLYIIEGHMNGRQPVILLDTFLPENHQDDLELTHYLYGGDAEYRLKQEIILGIGGIRLLHALGFEIHKYHMNEGHSALLGLELLSRYSPAGEELQTGESPYDISRVRELCCFTTHTPVEAGHDRFSYELVRKLMADFIPEAVLKKLAGVDVFNLTRLALNLSEYVNGVAKSHADISRHLFPGYKIRAVTNGIHPHTWACAEIKALFDRHVPGWCHEPEQLIRVECCVPDPELIQAHQEAKRKLLTMVEKTVGSALDPDLAVLGFARRMTAYKRPDLLFSNLDILREIMAKTPFQVVMAGKAHPHDAGGKQLIKDIHDMARKLAGVIPLVFLPDYNMQTALTLVSGVDLWLNTPLRPMEASGTSGMKAALNAVPNLSVLDGWWIEGCIEGITGWAVGDHEAVSAEGDADSLYRKLGETVLPLFYNDPAGWLAVMKNAVSKNASIFNSHRMMRRYATEAYMS
ncbi:MAG: alpha-glucan family phosphorylase [Pseudohongiellaceae bacterium]